MHHLRMSKTFVLQSHTHTHRERERVQNLVIIYASQNYMLPDIPLSPLKRKGHNFLIIVHGWDAHKQRLQGFPMALELGQNLFLQRPPPPCVCVSANLILKVHEIILYVCLPIVSLNTFQSKTKVPEMNMDVRPTPNMHWIYGISHLWMPMGFATRHSLQFRGLSLGEKKSACPSSGIVNYLPSVFLSLHVFQQHLPLRRVRNFPLRVSFLRKRGEKKIWWELVF